MSATKAGCITGDQTHLPTLVDMNVTEPGTCTCLQADVYGIAVTFFKVLSFDQPLFPGITKPMAKAFGVAQDLLHHFNPGCIPCCLWELMEQCWHTKSKQRIGLKDFYTRLLDIKAQAIQEVKTAKKQLKRF